MSRAPRRYEFRVIATDPADRAGIVRTSLDTGVASRFYAICEITRPVALSVRLEIRHDGAAARVVEIKVSPADGLRGRLTTTALRSVLVDQLVQAALAKEAERVGTVEPAPADVEPSLRARAFRLPGDPEDTFWVAPVPHREGHGRRTPDELAIEAAQHYRAAHAAGSPAPAMAVVKAMHVSRSTAARYIRRAREAGYLDPGSKVQHTPVTSSKRMPTTTFLPRKGQS